MLCTIHATSPDSPPLWGFPHVRPGQTITTLDGFGYFTSPTIGADGNGLISCFGDP